MVTRKKANTPSAQVADPIAAKVPRARRRSVAAGDVPRLDDLTELKTLVMDAEATVLARLTNSGTER